MSLASSEYMKEIQNVGWISEILSERFDNALELMTPNAVIYGGALRDCLAGKELLGDLDISVSREEVSDLSASFITNSKWIPMTESEEEMRTLNNILPNRLKNDDDQNFGKSPRLKKPGSRHTIYTTSHASHEPVPSQAPMGIEGTAGGTTREATRGETKAATTSRDSMDYAQKTEWDPHDTAEPGAEDSPMSCAEFTLPKAAAVSARAVASSGVLARKLAPMSTISTFKTINGNTIQIMASKYSTKDALSNAIYLARTVDIVCCGLVMLSNGRVFEVIPGAYEDCKNGILRINRGSDTMFLEALPARVEKLVARGWKNEINVEKEMVRIRAIQKKKEDQINKMQQEPWSNTHTFDYLPKHEKGNTYTISEQVTVDEAIRRFGSLDELKARCKGVAMINKVRISIFPSITSKAIYVRAEIQSNHQRKRLGRDRGHFSDAESFHMDKADGQRVLSEIFPVEVLEESSFAASAKHAYSWKSTMGDKRTAYTTYIYGGNVRNAPSPENTPNNSTMVPHDVSEAAADVHHRLTKTWATETGTLVREFGELEESAEEVAQEAAVNERKRRRSDFDKLLKEYTAEMKSKRKDNDE